MSKGKLAKFADMASYPHVFEYPYSAVDNVPFEMKGKWNESFFGNDRPIVLELGCGRGEYTVGLGRLFPDKNFIGVDIKGSRMWCLAGVRRAHKGRSDQARRARNVKGHVGGVEELRHDLAAILVDGRGELFPAGDKRVVVAAHVTRQIGIGGLDRHDLGDDQAYAALGTGTVMIDQIVGHISVIGQVGRYRRHKDAVLDLGRTDLNRAKEHRVGGGLHAGFLSIEPLGGSY